MDHPTDVEVADTIRYLKTLADRDPVDFRDQLARNITDPDATETLALRSKELAPLSLAACRELLDNSNQALRRRGRGSEGRARIERFINAVGRERRILETVVLGLQAEQGILPTAPSPRSRALRRLATENLKGDVPQGRFRELIEEEKENIRRAKAQQRAQRRKRRNSNR